MKLGFKICIAIAFLAIIWKLMAVAFALTTFWTIIPTAVLLTLAMIVWLMTVD